MKRTITLRPVSFLNFALRRKSTFNLVHTQSKRASYRSMYNSWIINQPLYQTPAVHTGPRLHSACCVWSRGVRCLCCGTILLYIHVHCALSNSTVRPCIVPACTRELHSACTRLGIAASQLTERRGPGVDSGLYNRLSWAWSWPKDPTPLRVTSFIFW